jgi:thiol-disulfide isomerase/thioredoxin
MKKIFFILALLFSLKVAAQTTVTTKIDKNTLVKDESGIELPYAIWQKMISDGGYRLIRAEDKVSFILHKSTAQEDAIDQERRKSSAERMPKPRASDSFKEGEVFKGDKMTDINGVKYDLRNPNGKIYVINFWFINCPPCKKEMPELNEIVVKYKGNKDVVFLAIALDQKSDLKDFLKTKEFHYNVIDDGRFYSNKHGVKSYPTHLIVGKDGLIKFSTLGLAPNTVLWVDKTIKAQLEGI